MKTIAFKWLLSLLALRPGESALTEVEWRDLSDAICAVRTRLLQCLQSLGTLANRSDRFEHSASTEDMASSVKLGGVRS